MGYSNEEETLPLYEESQRANAAGTQPPDLPHDKATPAEVRKFLFHVMHARGIGLDHAQCIASRWTLGTGRELKNYSVAMYRDVFAEDRWVVYKDVKAMHYSKIKKERNKTAWVMFESFQT